MAYIPYTIVGFLTLAAGVVTGVISQQESINEVIGLITGSSGAVVLGYFIVRWFVKREKALREENAELYRLMLDEKNKLINDQKKMIEKLTEED